MGLENIIDFIMGNLFFLFLLISGIFSFIKRSTQAQDTTEQRKNQPRPSNTPTIPNPFEVRELEPNPVFTTTEAEPTNSLDEESTINPFYEHLKKKERFEDNSNVKNDHRYRNSIEKKVQQQPVASVNFTKNISREKVVDGIIWAQILDQPRARKKHSVRRYYQKTKV